MVNCTSIFNMTNNCELSNNDAIVLELSIAFFGAILLAGFFYWREDKQRKKSDRIIKRQAGIIENIEKNRVERREHTIDQLLDLIITINGALNKRQDLIRYKFSYRSNPNQSSLDAEIEKYFIFITAKMRDVDYFRTTSTDVFKPTFIDVLNQLIYKGNEYSLEHEITQGRSSKIAHELFEIIEEIKKELIEMK